MTTSMKKLSTSERIRLKLRLADTTDQFNEVFGANSHRYFLDEPISMEEVELFEKKYHISLPEQYKWFLTEVGNGGIEYANSMTGNSGAGPFLGLFGLGHIGQFLDEPSTGYLTQETLYNEQWDHHDWFKRFYEDLKDATDEAYEKEAVQAYSGILAIGYCGCSQYLGIVLNGKDRGRVLNVYEDIEQCPHFFDEPTFLEWYEHWLDEIISGKAIFQNGITFESEENCIRRFQSDTDSYWKLVSLRYIRSFSSLSKESIGVLWKHYETEEDPLVLLLLISILVQHDYGKAKEYLAALLDAPRSFLTMLHLYARKHTKEWKKEVQQLKKNYPNDAEVQEYIQYVTKKDL